MARVFAVVISSQEETITIQSKPGTGKVYYFFDYTTATFREVFTIAKNHE